MLKPERKPIEDINAILENISMCAQTIDTKYLDIENLDKDILIAHNQGDLKKEKKLLKLKEKYLTIINFFGQSNIYQYDLQELPNSKIIISEEIFHKLQSYAKKTNLEQREFGCYLFGKKINYNTILFDDYSKVENKTYEREFETTPEMENEIIEKIDNNTIDCVCHVHTHPYLDGTVYSGTPSNYDLFVYAWFQEQHYNPNNRVSFMGALITPTEPGKNAYNDICFIFYDKNVKKFYKITNIWYYTTNEQYIKLNHKHYPQIRNNKIEQVEKRVVLTYQKPDEKK